MTTVWVTKYALSEGKITEVEVQERTDRYVRVEAPTHPNGWQLLFGRDWHDTREAAVDDAERRRITKVVSLRKQIAKLEALRFS